MLNQSGQRGTDSYAKDPGGYVYYEFERDADRDDVNCVSEFGGLMSDLGEGCGAGSEVCVFVGRLVNAWFDVT